MKRIMIMLMVLGLAALGQAGLGLGDVETFDSAEVENPVEYSTTPDPIPVDTWFSIGNGLSTQVVNLGDAGISTDYDGSTEKIMRVGLPGHNLELRYVMGDVTLADDIAYTMTYDVGAKDHAQPYTVYTAQLLAYDPSTGTLTLLASEYHDNDADPSTWDDPHHMTPGSLSYVADPADYAAGSKLVVGFLHYWGGSSASRSDILYVDNVSVSILPSDPDPFDGETNVERDVTLSWTTAADPNDPNSPNPAVKMHYLFGNFDNPGGEPSFIAEVAVGTDSYSLQSNPLDSLVTYEWYIEEAVDDGFGGYCDSGDPNNIVGVTWTFTTLDVLPTIDAQPTGVTVTEGETVEFTIVGGASVTDYGWYKVGDATLLSDTDTLTINAVQLADEGLYYCVVYNESGDSLESDRVGLWTKGLMAHWTFENTLIDEIGGYEGVYSDIDGNEPLYGIYSPSGVNGSTGLYFDSDNYIVRVTDSEDIFNFYTQGFTAEAWVYFDSVATQAIVGKNDYTNQQGWLSRFESQTAETIIRTGDSTSVHVTDQLGSSYYYLNSGRWYYVVTTYEPGERVAVYVDGRLTAEETTDVPDSIPSSTVPLIFGASDADGSNPFGGLLDEVKLWNYPLTDRDILQNYVNVTGVEECFVNPIYDFTGPDGDPDCVVDIHDFVYFASAWLNDDFVEPSSN